MTGKRAIDRKREAAVKIEIQDSEDRTGIRAVLTAGKTFYIIADGGIYRANRADDIDPQRTNIDLPDLCQKVLSYGFRDPIVGRVLVTAQALFDRNHLDGVLDCEEATAIGLEMTILLIEIREISRSMQSDIDAIMERGLPSDTSRSLEVPSVQNLRTRAETYIRKCDEIRGKIIGLLKLVYDQGKTKTVLENLVDSIAAKHGADAEMTRFFGDIRPKLATIRNIRNGIDHPRDDNRTAILDFNMRPDGLVEPPSIALINPDTPQPRMPMSAFMDQMTEYLAEICES